MERLESFFPYQGAKPNNKRQTTNNKRQTTDDRRQTTNDRRQTTDDKRQTTSHKHHTQQTHHTPRWGSCGPKPTSKMPVSRVYSATVGSQPAVLIGPKNHQQGLAAATPRTTTLDHQVQYLHQRIHGIQSKRPENILPIRPPKVG